MYSLGSEMFPQDFNATGITGSRKVALILELLQFQRDNMYELLSKAYESEPTYKSSPHAPLFNVQLQVASSEASQ